VGGRDEEAEEAFQRALGQDATNAVIYNALATLYLNQGEVQKAIVTAETGINKAPGYPDLYYTLGLGRYQSGQFGGASQSLERALELRPKFPDAALWLGNTYLVQSKLAATGGGDPTKLSDAIAQFRRAVELGPDVAGYHSALAEGLYQHRDLAEARTEMESAIELDPGNAKYQLMLGKVCDQLDDLDAAAAAFQRATELNPTDAEAFYGLGLVRFKRQQDGDAVAALRSALKINPYHADAHEKLGQTLIRMGQQEEGQKELSAAEDSRTREAKINDMRRASAADPSNTELANNLGIELARQGDFEDAMQAFQRALASSPRFIDAQYQIGGLYMQRGKPLEAIKAFMTVDKMQPGYRWTNYYLAKLNEKIGRKTEAEKRMRAFEAQKAAGKVTEN
jgi:superkiller protein 3